MKIKFKFHQITLFTFLLFFASCFNTTTLESNYVCGHGTNWYEEFYGIIQEDDPSSFASIAFDTQKSVEMWDRDVNDNQGGWIYPEAWVYQLNYDDKITSEIRIRKTDFDKVEATQLAKKYGYKMGQLPACLREGVDSINILKSDALFGGNRWKYSIEITIGETSELYEQTGNMEETLFHEATHATLDYLYGENWGVERDKDQQYISKYAYDFPDREDIAESFVVYTALTHKKDRISKKQSKRINKAIPNRMEFFKDLDLNMYPISRGQ